MGIKHAELYADIKFVGTGIRKCS